MGGKDEPLDPELLRNIDVLSPNDTELRRIVEGKEFENAETNELITKVMTEHPGLDVLFKQGADGATYYDNRIDSYMDAKFKDDIDRVGGIYDTTQQSAYNFKDFEGRA